MEDMLLILYRDPEEALSEALAKREIVLGEWVIGEGMPTHFCKACKNQFGYLKS
ncbi:MAG: hypothetical protein VYC17_02475 [Nitrospinota bacterium]|nr:hypothetical protein [Nitrospinota bacterium]